MKVAGIKMVKFTQYSQKKSIEKFGNFSPTDNPPHSLLMTDEHHAFHQQGKGTKNKPIRKINTASAVLIPPIGKHKTTLKI